MNRAVPNPARPIQTFSTVAAADRKRAPWCIRGWKPTGRTSGSHHTSRKHLGHTGTHLWQLLPVCCRHGENGRKWLGEPQAVPIHRENSCGTRGTTSDSHFRFETSMIAVIDPVYGLSFAVELFIGIYTLAEISIWINKCDRCKTMVFQANATPGRPYESVPKLSSVLSWLVLTVSEWPSRFRSLEIPGTAPENHFQSTAATTEKAYLEILKIVRCWRKHSLVYEIHWTALERLVQNSSNAWFATRDQLALAFGSASWIIIQRASTDCAAN